MYGMLFNAFLLSFYSVMVFTSHDQCQSKKGKANVTKFIQIAFIAGFMITSLDFINSAFFEFYIRMRTHREKTTFGYIHDKTERFALQYAVLEWVLRAIMVLVSFAQLAIRKLSASEYCISETKDLELEGTWLSWLICL